MMNLVYKAGGQKHCRPVKSLEELMAACNTPENIRAWNDCRRTGEDRYKRALVQVCYNCQVPEGGLLKGVKTVSPFFFYDIDCRGREDCRRIISQLLAMKDELGLVEVAESANYGVHAVARRTPGRTILECQVRISMLTKTEMDTNNKENNRVVFHGPIDAETTPLLDEALFAESLSDEEAAAEYLQLKEREAQGLEEVPPGARKANKHYRPWEESGMSAVAAPSGVEAAGARQSSSGLGSALAVAALQCCSSQTACDPGARYNGVLFSDIIAKYWELFNDGKKPSEGDCNVLTFELAMTLRSICGYSPEKMMAVVPNYWEAPSVALSAQAPRAAQGHRQRNVGHQLRQNRPECPRRGLQHRLPRKHTAEREQEEEMLIHTSAPPHFAGISNSSAY